MITRALCNPTTPNRIHKIPRTNCDASTHQNWDFNESICIRSSVCEFLLVLHVYCFTNDTQIDGFFCITANLRIIRLREVTNIIESNCDWASKTAAVTHVSFVSTNTPINCSKKSHSKRAYSCFAQQLIQFDLIGDAKQMLFKSLPRH